MCGSKDDADAAPRTMIYQPEELNHHHLFMDWNKPNDLITQEQPPFLLHDPHHQHHHHHLMLDPPPETLIHFPSPPTLLEEGKEEEDEDDDDDDDHLDPMKEMQFSFAAMQPIDIDPATVPKPNRRNVRISDDPQTVVARRRRERISEKIRILKRIVPGGAKMDTASMLDEAIRYTKFLKRKVKMLQPSNHSQQLAAPISDPTYLCYYHNSET